MGCGTEGKTNKLWGRKTSFIEESIGCSPFDNDTPLGAGSQLGMMYIVVLVSPDPDLRNPEVFVELDEVLITRTEGA